MVEKKEKVNYFSKFGVIWYAGPTVNVQTGKDMGDGVLGPYCIKKNCRVDLEIKFPPTKSSSLKLLCPVCNEIYEIPFTSLLKARDVLLNEYQSLSRRGDAINIINLDNIDKYKQKIDMGENKWMTVTVEAKGENLENVHIMVGDKNDNKKAHIIVSGKTGEIRIDEKDDKPEKYIKSVESKVKTRKSKVNFK